jgi:ATP-dependent Clp protease ATP-binding subunit ClpA
MVECCTDVHLHANLTGLKTVLGKSLFGQHLVLNPVINTIRGHINDPSPIKPLVISFHGWTGNGKNFVTKFITEHLFSYGMQSRFVRKFIASLDFAHESHSVLYRYQVRRQIVETVALCERRSLFIFDEMDKLPAGVIDGIIPLLGHSAWNIDGIDLRRAIFVFISNLGGQEINDYVLKAYQSGRSRASLSTKEMEQIISQLRTDNSWFWSLIERDTIDLLVPFLPMEKQHVKMCVKADMENKGYLYSSSDLERVANEMVYFPEESQLFSVSGCKKVSSKTDLLMG